MDIQNELTIDFSQLLEHSWSIKKDDTEAYSAEIEKAASEVNRLRMTGKGPDGSEVFFTHLPYILSEDLLMSESERETLKKLDDFGKQQDILISIGIGGSYLGNQAIFDAFCGPYWNLMDKEERNVYPKVFFAGQNLDPTSLLQLADQVGRESKEMGRKCKVILLVISKSGTTIEPSSAIHGLTEVLKPFADIHILAITDKEKGVLRQYANEHHLTCFTVPDGIGGRFSVFSQVGLVFASLVGIPIGEFLQGAQMVEESCRSEDISENPALMLAALKFIAMKEYGITAEVVMPYGDKLRSFGWWYAQLLGESLGKKYDLNGNVVYNGRTPVASVGTTDMHSLTQEHQQGKKNKLVQFISVEQLPEDLSVLCDEKDVSGMVPMSRMLAAARSANEEALAKEGRMSCHISMKKLTPFHVGALMYFFFLTIAYEGAMAHVNAFDQPGVEDYKKILHEELRKYILEN